MSTVKVMIRMWHGGIFTDNMNFNGNQYHDVPEYDIFQDGEAFITELILADYGYDNVARYAFKDKKTGEFEIVNNGDDFDFVKNALKYVDDKNVVEIYCECVTEKEKTVIEKGKESLGSDGGRGKATKQGNKRKGKEKVADEVDEEEVFDDIVIEDDSISDDDMEDNDFTDEDEEFFDLRRDKRAYRQEMSMKKISGEQTSLVVVNIESPAREAIDLNITTDGVFEEDLDSDASIESLDDEGQKRVKTKLYSSNIQPKDLELELGLRFKDTTECQRVVRGWAVANGYNLRWAKSSHGKLCAVCVTGCKWRLYASRIHGEPTCVIKTLTGEHTCARAEYNRQASSKFIADHFLAKMRTNPNITNKDMVNEIRLIYGTTVRPMKCYRGKWRALEQIRGTFYDHYATLRSYISELMNIDKEGHFELKTYLDKEDNTVFERFYIGFSSLRKGFLIGCRKYIGFDACFLKTVLGGALLAAVSKDCNNKMYPIAWAVVEKENEATWTWFFERLFEDLNISDGLGWTFMSDKQKGLINGIQKLAPNGEHRHCARHVYANWKKHFPGPKFKEMFWQIVRSTCTADYELSLNLLKDECPRAADDFLSKGPTSFCKALINLFTKTDTILNNVCESFNSYILRSRDKCLIDMLEDIRMSLMTRLYDLSTNNEKLLNAPDPLCPNIRIKLTKIHGYVRFCDVRPAVGGKYEVHYRDDAHIVDLVQRVCTCRLWELTGIPCSHEMACIFHNRGDPVDYVDRFYFKENARDCYKYGLSPVPGPRAWPRVDGPSVLPPVYSKAPGRPKKQRKRGLDDMQTKTTGKLSMRGLRMSCKNCGGFDHNKRTCKQPARVIQEPVRATRVSIPQATQPRAPPSNMGPTRYNAQINTQNGSIFVQEPGARRYYFPEGHQAAIASRTGRALATQGVENQSSQETHGNSQVDNPTQT